jgi:hypothetical protein
LRLPGLLARVQLIEAGSFSSMLMRFCGRAMLRTMDDWVLFLAVVGNRLVLAGFVIVVQLDLVRRAVFRDHFLDGLRGNVVAFTLSRFVAVGLRVACALRLHGSFRPVASYSIVRVALLAVAEVLAVFPFECH